jgi:hypothetical protein
MVMRTNTPPQILQNWADSISLRNPKIMTDFYTDSSVLLATYYPFLFGKKDIENYFVDFLNKKDLNCKIIENYNQVDRYTKVIISSGFYIFSFVDENNQNVNVDARYSYVFYDNKIINHHSSETPKI